MENLKNLFDKIQEDNSSTKQLVEVVGLLIEKFNKSKQEIENLSKENQDKLREDMNKLMIQHQKFLDSTEETVDEKIDSIQEIYDQFSELFDEIKSLKNKTIKGEPGKDGKDGKQGPKGEDAKPVDENFIIEKVIEKIDIPEFIAETGESIIVKINSLPIDDDEYKIDWKHIKNVPDFSKGQAVVAGNRFLDQLVDVNVSGLTKDANGRYILGSGGSPALPLNSIQYNDNGAFAGSANLTYDGITLSVGTPAVFAGTVSTPQLITTANAITATGNAATVPVTSKNNIVTNNSAATLTITLTTAGAVNMQDCIVQILDFNAVAQTIVWVNTEDSTVTAPTTTNGSTTLPLTIGLKFNSATSKWRFVAKA